MNKFLFLSFLITLGNAYVPNVPSPSFRSANSQLKDLAVELEEIWYKAAAIGEDASVRTVGFVQSRASEYKTRVTNRVIEQTDNLKRNTESLSSAKREYKNALNKALRSFQHRIADAERKFMRELDEISNAYNDNLSCTSEDGFGEDDVFFANEHHIQNSAVAEELFQVGVDTAELFYREAVLNAEEKRYEFTLI